MGLFKRIKDLLEANVSDLVGKAEDPEKMLNLYMEKATGELTNFSIQVNRAVADQIALNKKIETAQKEVETCTEQARLAVQQDRDDLARLALEKKQVAQSALADYQAQEKEQESVVAELKKNYQLLEQKLSQARSERDQLVMRQRRAMAMKKADDAVQDLIRGNGYNDIERMKEKVDHMDAEAQASRLMIESSVEYQFEQLKKSSQNSSIEEELAKLKEESGKK